MEFRSTSDPLRGQCACGELTYDLHTHSSDGTSLLKFSGYCHCSRCQIAHGAPVIATTHWKPGAFVLTSPPSSQRAFPGGGGFDLSCSKCSTPVAYENGPSYPGHCVYPDTLLREGEDKKIVGLQRLAPTDHIFYSTRRFDIADGLPKWNGWRGTSEQVG